MWRLYPLMPKPGEKRYINAAALLANGGVSLSVESFYLIKICLFIVAFIFTINIQITNVGLNCRSIMTDLNFSRTAMDAYVASDPERVQLELYLFQAASEALDSASVSLKMLTDEDNRNIYTEYISNLISNSGISLKEDAVAAAKRLYLKLVTVRSIQSQYRFYLEAFLLSVAMFFMPNLIVISKIKLIEDKRDWEVLHFIYVFSIFGRLPPFSIKEVLSGMLLVSDLFKNLLSSLLNSLKSGKAEDAFKETLSKTDNQDIYELLEMLRLSINTGLLGIVDSVDEMAVNQQKWLEVKSMKRRKTKQVYAMIPVAAAMLLAAIYFSYSLSILTDPSYFIK